MPLSICPVRLARGHLRLDPGEAVEDPQQSLIRRSVGDGIADGEHRRHALFLQSEWIAPLHRPPPPAAAAPTRGARRSSRCRDAWGRSPLCWRPRNRRAVVIAGDDSGGKATVTDLLDQFGFDTVDAGPLNEGWRIQRDTPGYGPRRTAEELRNDLTAAKRYADSSR
jgi:hypothetical protein